MKNITDLDKYNMLDILLGLPKQCQDATGIAKGFKIPPGYQAGLFNKVLFTGLGGSAIGGDIVRAYLSDRISMPIVVNRNYDVPAFVDKKTLVFACSYSGDTEETISAYSRIKKKGAKLIVITAGGRMKKLSDKDKVPCILIPAGIPPRTAIGYMVVIPLVILSRMKFIRKQDAALKETIDVLKYLKQNILNPSVPAPLNVAKCIAEKLYNRFIIVYGADNFLGAVAARWRQELEENSKVLALAGVFPEMNHNEITGWEDVRHISKDFSVIFLRDKDEHPRVSRRIEISRDIIKRRAENIIEIASTGKSLLARTFSLIYTGTFVSFYLAILNNADPTPVNNVTYLKKQLAVNK